MASFELFGFEIKKKKEDKEQKSVVSVTPDDGTTEISTSFGNGYFSHTIDLDGVVKGENALIQRYRSVSQYPDCDAAIEDIVNEAIVCESSKEKIVELILDDVKVSESIKTKFRDEFGEVLRLFKFEDKGHDIFRSWYIDGRIYYHILLNDARPKDGIQELRYVDPRKIRKIRNVKKERNNKGIEINGLVEEYYLYNDKGLTSATTQGIKLSVDSVIYCPSGLLDTNTNMMLSNLHKAIKPVNQLKMIEDSLVIYRISRAPERRIFYIDVGNLPKVKAEQYVNDMMNKFRNKIVYDAVTGEVRDDRKNLSMMEDFWMPRREGGLGTEITTLPGGQNLGDIADINYFQNKLYASLNVPITRMQPATGFSLGRTTEITRDEIKFNKFITRLRKKFSGMFADTLRVQLIAKGIIRADEWELIAQDIKFEYQMDNHFAELKNNEIMQQRINLAQLVDPYIGKYYSQAYVRKNILMQSDVEIKKINIEMSGEGEFIAAQQAQQMGQPQEQQQQGE